MGFKRVRSKNGGEKKPKMRKNVRESSVKMRGRSKKVINIRRTRGDITVKTTGMTPAFLIYFTVYG